MSLRGILALNLLVWSWAGGMSLAQDQDHGNTIFSPDTRRSEKLNGNDVSMGHATVLHVTGTEAPSCSAEFRQADLNAAVQTVLQEHPELILEALEKNQIALAELVERGAMAKHIKAEQDRRVAELENPKIPDIDETRPIRGHRDASVTIVEYSDFECPYCSAASSTVEEILQQYEGTVRFVYKHNPLSFHAMAEPAARYFEAIALQDHAQAWVFHDRVFAQQDQLAEGEELLKAILVSLEIDRKQFEKDLYSETIEQRITKDREEAERFGFDGTPAFLVNGLSLMGNQPLEDFEDLIRLSMSK